MKAKNHHNQASFIKWNSLTLNFSILIARIMTNNNFLLLYYILASPSSHKL
jgi:hypothetical protein